MKKLYFILISLLSIFNSVKGQTIASKISNDGIQEIKAWHYVIGLNDKSSVLLWADRHRTKFFMKKYDQEATLEFEKEIWKLESKKGGKVEISGVYVINNDLVFFMSFRTRKDIKFFRLIINSKTGEKISEEEISSYQNLNNDYIKYNQYFFDITKNDTQGIYYFMTFIRTKENNSELKVMSYSYDHKQISAVSKTIDIYKSFNLISSIQNGKDYYFGINYARPTAKEDINKNEIIIYKVSGQDFEEMLFPLEKYTNNQIKNIYGQFSTNQFGNVKLAISNSYYYKNDYQGPGITDVYVLEFSKKTLVLDKIYDVVQDKILSVLPSTNITNEQDWKYILNYPVSFYANFNGHDEIIFQSCIKNTTGAAALSKISDIGIFEFNDNGKIIKSKLIPLQYEIYPDALYKNDFPFLDDVWKKGNTSQYDGPYPYSNLFKRIDFINFQEKTFIFYNDHKENLDSDNSNRKELSKVKESLGMVLIRSKSGSVNSSILNSNEQAYFDFSSASFNEKTGIYSVICYKKNNEFYISYLNLK